MDEEVSARVLRCARAAGIAPEHLGVMVPSWSNHTVMVDGPRPAVLRVCALGNTERLTAEALLLQELPAEIGAPTLIDHGRDGELTWALAERLSGSTLAQAWPDLDDDQRQRAAQRTAELLQQYYAHRPSAALTEVLLRVPTSPDLVGGAILAWPTSRLRALLDDPRCTLRDDQRERISQVVARNQSLVPQVDQPGLGLIHGDLHLGNIWWDGAQVSGLIDLEWARLAAPWADLGRTQEKVLANLAETPEEGHPGFVADLIVALPAWQVDDQRRLMATLGYLVRQSLLWERFGPNSPADHVVHLTDQVLDEAGW